MIDFPALFRRWIVRAVVLGLGLLVCVTARGQVENDPIVVPVDFTGSFNNTEPNISEGDEPYLSISVTPSALLDGIAFSPGWTDLGHQQALLKPGKDYVVTLGAVRLREARLLFSPPAGYRVFVDQVERTSFQWINGGNYLPGSGSFVIRIEDPSAAPVGEASSLRPGRLIWSVGLGNLKSGKAAGVISMRESAQNSLSSTVYTRGTLNYNHDGSEVEVINDAGGLRQVYVTNALADIVTVNDHAYAINFYQRNSGQISATKSNNLYTVSGTPLYSYLVENPAYPANSSILRITKTTHQGAGASDYITWTELRLNGPASNGNAVWQVADWVEKAAGATSLTSPVNQRWTYTGNGLTELVETLDGGATVSGSVYREYNDFNWGRELKTETIGNGLTNLVTTTYDYYTNSLLPGNYRRLKSVTVTGGSWTAFDYYNDNERCGQTAHVYRPFKGAPATPTFDAAQGAVTTYDYALDWTGMAKTLPASVVTTVNGTTSGKSLITYDFSQTITDHGATYQNSANAVMPLTVATRKDYYNSTQFLTTIIKTFREDADPENRFYSGLPHSIARPDGTMSVDVYFRGVYLPSSRSFSFVAGSSEWMHLTLHGTTVASGANLASTYSPAGQNQTTEANFYLIPGRSTATADVHAANGMVVWTEARIYDGSWNTIQRDLTAYTDSFYPQYTSRDAGDSLGAWNVATNEWSKGRLDATTDQTGIRKTFLYDSAGRVQSVTRTSAAWNNLTIAALTSTYTYDAAGHVLTEVTGGPGESLTTTRVFDTAGRLTSETPPGLGATTYSYDPANRRTTVTAPSGSTQITQAYLDGQTQQITGTGVVAQYFDAGVETSGGVRYQQVNLTSATSVRYNKTRADWLGRPVQTIRPGFTGQPEYAESQTYDATTGRLSRSDRTGFAPTFYEYNSASQLVRSGLDLSGNNTLDLASADRISDTDTSFVKIDGNYWLSQTASVYPDQTSTAKKDLSTTLRRLTGLTSSLRQETHAVDADGNDTVTQVTVDPASKLVTTTTTRPGLLAAQIDTTLNGFPVSTTSPDGLIYSRTYDALGRLSTQKDPRTGSSTLAYWPNTGLVSKVTDAAGKVVSQMFYDTSGRPFATVNGAGYTTRLEYNGRGQVVNQWGNGVYPMSYVYDNYGQRSALRTYQDRNNAVNWDTAAWPGGAAPFNETSWQIDEPSGLVSSKTDAAGKKVIFTYNARGQTATRKWARGITTTYSYVTGTGELSGIIYDDGVTPAVSYGYTRLGQTDTVTDVTGTRTFSYDPTAPWRMASLALPGYYGSRTLTFNYDNATSTDTGETSYPGHKITSVFGRSHGYNLGNELLVKTAWSDTGRLAGLADANRVFAYAYDANAPLVRSMTSGGFSVSRDFEPNRDLVTRIEATWNGVSLTKYTYTYNNFRQRDRKVQSGSAFAGYADSDDAIHESFDYTTRGELKTARTYLGSNASSTTNPLAARQHEFAYDAIGNRLSANTSGVDGTKDRFEVNSLNQYTSRENNTLPVGGTVASGADVVAGKENTVLAGRAGRYWGDNALLPNQSGPYYSDFTTYAVRKGAGGGGTDLAAFINRTAFIPKASQALTYDADGNLQNDGVWDYTYDAENRLIQQSTTLIAVSFGVPNQVLRFAYDAQGRRIQKRVTNGSTGAEISSQRFLYNGWTLIAEFAAPGGTTCGSLLRTYVWGGAINGGLLAINDKVTNRSYFPTYDGNGNVASLADASNGAIAAVYEYSPFGELLRCDGSYAKQNPFRFSTEYTDDESGLVYYGKRYYDPRNGRFINRDPIEESGGLNLYGFCGNDGVNRTDDLGQSWLSEFHHKVTGTLFGHDPLGGAMLRTDRWVNHQWNTNPYFRVAVAVAASIVTYGAASGWAFTAATAESGASGFLVSSIASGTISSTTASVLAGAIGGAAGGIVSGVTLGEKPSQIAKGALIGAIVGGLSAYIKETSSSLPRQNFDTNELLADNTNKEDLFSRLTEEPKTLETIKISGKKILTSNGLGNEAHRIFYVYAARLSATFFKERSRAPDGAWFGGRVDFGSVERHDIYDIKPNTPYSRPLGRAQINNYSTMSHVTGLGPGYNPGDGIWVFPSNTPVVLRGDYATYTYFNAGKGLVLYNAVLNEGYTTAWAFVKESASNLASGVANAIAIGGNRSQTPIPIVFPEPIPIW